MARLIGFFAKPTPLFALCMLGSWLIYYFAHNQNGFADRILALQVELQTLWPMVALCFGATLIGSACYVSHHQLRIASLDYKARALASKTNKDRFTKLATSLSKDAAGLATTAMRFLLTLYASLTLLILDFIWSTLFPDALLYGVQWRYAVVIGLASFAGINLIVALHQLHGLVAKRMVAA